MKQKIFIFRLYINRIAKAVKNEIRKRKLFNAICVCNTKENFVDICETFTYYLKDAGYINKDITEIVKVLENTFDDILDEYFC